MVNNIGRTTKTLNTSLGGTTSFTPSDNLTILAGVNGVGLLIFDSDGTLGVVTTYTDSQSNFIVTTYALSINIPSILALSY